MPTVILRELAQVVADVLSQVKVARVRAAQVKVVRVRAVLHKQELVKPGLLGSRAHLGLEVLVLPGLIRTLVLNIPVNKVPQPQHRLSLAVPALKAGHALRLPALQDHVMVVPRVLVGQIRRGLLPLQGQVARVRVQQVRHLENLVQAREGTIGSQVAHLLTSLSWGLPSPRAVDVKRLI